MWDICTVEAMNRRAGPWQGTSEKEEGKSHRMLHWVPQSPRDKPENSWWWKLSCAFLIVHHLLLLTSSWPPRVSTLLLSCMQICPVNVFIISFRFLYPFPSSHCSSTLLVLNHSKHNTDYEQADTIWMHLDIFCFHFPPSLWLFLPHSFSSLYLLKWGSDRRK